jgi:hypothetical protein
LFSVTISMLSWHSRKRIESDGVPFIFNLLLIDRVNLILVGGKRGFKNDYSRP